MDIKPPQPAPSAAGPAPEPAPKASGSFSSSPSGESKNRSGWRSILSTVLLFLMAPIIAIAIAAFALQSYQVDGMSMETTLQNSDRLIVNKIPRTWSRITHHPYVPKRGDIVVFNQAGLFDATGASEKQLIKRVIGLPGDHVVIQSGFITIYNKQHPNGFNPDKTVGYVITAPTTPGTINVTLGKDQIFVCGDNRGNSEDSRYFGPVNVDRIVGQLVLRIVPLNKTERF